MADPTQGDGGKVRPKILVVDDDPIVRACLASLLAHVGLDHEVADDPCDAFELFKRGRFSAVISDFDMPGMTGLELARNIREHSPDMLIFAFTGTSGERFMQEDLSVFDHVFEKPSEHFQLIEEVLASVTTRAHALI